MAEKITIKAEKETLLITLMARAMESQKENPIVSDSYAVNMVEKIDYDFSSLKVPVQTVVTVCMRSVQFDRYCRNFINCHKNPVVIHLGCGLDSRYFRIGQPEVKWYDIDFPDVVELKKRFFKDSTCYKMVPSDAMDSAWRKELLTPEHPVLILAEGLFMYIPETELQNMINEIVKYSSHGELIFDAYSRLTAKRVKNHPSFKKTGAVAHWGIDDPAELESWNPGLHFVEEWYFSKSPDVEKLKGGFRFLFTLAGKFKAANMAHRVIRYKINPENSNG